MCGEQFLLVKREKPRKTNLRQVDPEFFFLHPLTSEFIHLMHDFISRYNKFIKEDYESTKMSVICTVYPDRIYKLTFEVIVDQILQNEIWYLVKLL